MVLLPSQVSDLEFWIRGKDLGSGSVTTINDASIWGNTFTGAGGSVVTGATPSGGKALSGTNMNYLAREGLNLNGGPLRASASSMLNTGYVPQNAVDGDLGSMWSPTSITGWLMVRRQAGPAAATSYQITPRNLALAQAPTAWTFEGSMNGSSWTTLDSRSGITWPSGAEQSFSFSNPTAYVYYRLNITANNGDANTTIVNFTLDHVSNSASLKDAELWMVVKTNGGSGPQSWRYGTNVAASHYTYGGSIYEGFGTTNRFTFTPTLSPASWRLYRVRVQGTNWTAWIDNVQQFTNASSTKAWQLHPYIFDTFSGQSAETFLFSRAITSDETAGLITYVNSEHGLLVPGGAPDGPVTYWGTLLK